MAHFEQRDLWSPVPWPGLYLVTTNSIVTRYYRHLVMGRGSALEAKQRIPGIEFEIMDHLTEFKLDGTEDYGFRVIRDPRRDNRFGFGILQTKRHWKHVAVVETIVLSLSMLHHYAERNPDVTIRCPLPAAGCGWIGTGTPPDPKAVRAVCETLPNNVTFCSR
jgi:hypothetical protein